MGVQTSAVKHSFNTVQHALQTLRYKRFAKAAYITTESRKPILNLALAMQQRAWMQGLWDAAKIFDLPAKFRRFNRLDEALMENLGLTGSVCLLQARQLLA